MVLPVLKWTTRIQYATGRRFKSILRDNDVFAISYARTPIGKMAGSLSSKSAPELGSLAIKSAIEKCNFPSNFIEEAFVGNVCGAGIGQAPARQAILGLPMLESVDCTTVNKVCASGMKAVMFASLSIQTGYRHVCIAAGMESMSNVPYYLPQARTGYRLQNKVVVDGLIHDGLWDVYNNQHMGVCGELCAETYGISREDQDLFAIQSYEKAASAWSNGKFSDEVVKVNIPNSKRGGPPISVTEDEEYTAIQIDKVRTLKPAFKADGTVTAANSSKISDGASAIILVSGKFCNELGITPLFRISGYGDAAKAPAEFTTAPAMAIKNALLHAKLSLKDIDYHEINEAFAVVPIINAR